MQVAVVANQVTPPFDLAKDVARRSDAAANDEEHGSRAILIQPVEHSRRDVRVRAIVERQENRAPGRRREPPDEQRPRHQGRERGPY